MVCFDKNFYLFLINFFLNTYFGPYQTDLGPVSDWIGKRKKKKSVTDVRAATSTAARRVHAYQTQVRWPNRRTCAFQVHMHVLVADV